MEFAGTIRSEEAACEAEMGNLTLARQKAADALAISSDQDTRTSAALVFALTGDDARAQTMLGELAKESPSATLLIRLAIPVGQAMIELQHNQPGKAIELLETSRPIELGAPPDGANYIPIYVRAGAYLRMRDGAKAAVEYQKILDHRGIDPISGIYTLAHLGLGRAYALQGETAKAKTAYQDFFAVWKNADADLPVLKDAKAEYGRLP
jgi:tetratricopeptide (TPR) repeat protein